MKVTKQFEYDVHENADALDSIQKELLKKCSANLKNSYSPYSKFKVSCALLLDNGETVLGTNQENMAYPSGLCAERVAFFAAHSSYPNAKILRAVITAKSENYLVDHPVTPCGACRQVMLEYEIEQNDPIELILKGEEGKIFVLSEVKHLVPLHFFEINLKDN